MKNERNNCINSVNLNADSDFPYLVLDVVGDQSYPRNPGFQVMHWHEDLQFIYVLDGEIEIKTLDTSVQVNKGSGIFINKNVIHLVKKSLSCHYNSFIFPDYFLKFYFGSPAAAFVERIVGKDELPICCFPKEKNRCQSILSVLSRLADLENRKTEFYAYEVLCLLCDKLDVGLEYLLSDFLSESNAEQNPTMHQILDTLNHMDAEDQKFILDYILLYQSHLQDVKEGSQH